MAIVISTPEIPETLVYDRVLLRELKITQGTSQDGSVPPVYAVDIDYVIYALDSNKKRHFKKKSFGAKINDYKSTALAQADLGDTRMIDALYAIESALAQIITAKGNIGDVTTVPDL